MPVTSALPSQGSPDKLTFGGDDDDNFDPRTCIIMHRGKVTIIFPREKPKCQKLLLLLGKPLRALFKAISVPISHALEGKGQQRQLKENQNLGTAFLKMCYFFVSVP